MKDEQSKEKRGMNEIVPEIGDRLSKFRLKMDISQREVAEAAEVTRAYVTQVETGRANPSFKLLYQMRKKYKLSVDWLLSGEGEMIISANSISDVMTDEHYELLKKLTILEPKRQSRYIRGFLEIVDEDC